MHRVLKCAEFVAELGHKLLDLKLAIALDVHESPKLSLCTLDEILYSLEFTTIGTRDGLVLVIKVAVYIGLELIELIQLVIMLALMILDFLHKFTLNFKL